jgi:hypothetical protein
VMGYRSFFQCIGIFHLPRALVFIV